jgi:hypothetical protein
MGMLGQDFTAEACRVDGGIFELIGASKDQLMRDGRSSRFLNQD